jgi:exosortase/archaeosortase
MTVWAFIYEPLKGKTSLSRVFWLYGVLGSILVSAAGLLVNPLSVRQLQVYVVLSLLFSLYVTVATYLCAGNCASKAVAVLARISAVISLLALPFVAYFGLNGTLELANYLQ